MKREGIERLAMDLALGELTEDAAALFEVYLATHPQAEQWAREMLDACAVAQRAVAEKTRVPQSRSVVSTRRVHRARYIAWSVVGRRAAVAIFALLAGLAAGRWSAGRNVSQPGPPRLVVQDAPEQRSWARLAQENGQGFWHAKAQALLEPKPPAVGPSTKRADLWNEYRRYIKEQRDG